MKGFLQVIIGQQTQRHPARQTEITTLCIDYYIYYTDRVEDLECLPDFVLCAVIIVLPRHHYQEAGELN